MPPLGLLIAQTGSASRFVSRGGCFAAAEPVAAAGSAGFDRRSRWLDEAPLGAGAAARGVCIAGDWPIRCPAVLIEAAKGSIDDSTRVALFSLVPVLAVVLEPHFAAASSQQRYGLAAGLIAVVGTLLVFPLEPPQTLQAALAFFGIVAAAASVAAANCTGVRIACDPHAPSMFSIAAVAAGAAASVLAVLSALLERQTWAVPRLDLWSALGLLALALLFWLMRRMSAVRMTTRFLFAPLLANLIGLAFLRPGVQMRGWIGLLLIALRIGLAAVRA